MVTAVRAGASMRSVARQFHVSLHTVQRWTARAAHVPLSRVDWSTHAPIAKTIQRTEAATEDLVLTLRRELKDVSPLGECGAVAIHRALTERVLPAPAIRTIGRILERRGALDGQRRVRRPAPPRGWYLPDVEQRRAELDSFDVIEGLVIQGGPEVDVLTGTSLHGGLIGVWPGPPVTAKMVVEALVEHWRDVGLPTYAQFDNDTRLQGAHQYRDCVSRVMRLCLSLGIMPVFVPVNEPAFQAALENLNGRWQAKVWGRFHHADLTDLREHSTQYVSASRQRAAGRIESAPIRRPFPTAWQLDLQAVLYGSLVFLRRTTAQGTVSVLGHSSVQS